MLQMRTKDQLHADKMRMYVAHAYLALTEKKRTGYSNDSLARVLSHQHNLDYNPSTIGKLLNAARILQAYPMFEYWRITDSNRLYDLHKIPDHLRQEVFTSPSGYLRTPTQCVSIFTADRTSWNLALVEARKRHPKPNRLNDPKPAVEELRS